MRENQVVLRPLPYAILSSPMNVLQIVVFRKYSPLSQMAYLLRALMGIEEVDPFRNAVRLSFT